MSYIPLLMVGPHHVIKLRDGRYLRVGERLQGNVIECFDWQNNAFNLPNDTEVMIIAEPRYLADAFLRTLPPQDI